MKGEDKIISVRQGNADMINLVMALLIGLCVLLIMVAFVKLTWGFWEGLLGEALKETNTYKMLGGK